MKGDKNKTKLEIRHYYDSIEEEHYYFYSDAKQDLIDGLSFNGFWHDVKHILQNWGYVIVEIDLNNTN